jgi:integrase
MSSSKKANGILESGRFFPSTQRDDKGRVVYIQIKQKCDPETEDRAREVSEAIENEYLSIVHRVDEPLTVGEYLKQFLQAKKGKVARRTYEIDGELFDRYVKGSSIADSPLSELKPLAIQRYYSSLEASGVSGSMVRKLHSFLTSAFNQGVKWEALPKNPTVGVMLPKVVKNEAVSLSPDEARDFMQKCLDDDKYLVLAVALETGMRPGEYLALTWKDVNWHTPSISVRQAIAINFKGGGFEIKETKTRGSRRTIKISDTLAERLRLHRDRQKAYIVELQKAADAVPLLDHMKAKGANYQKRRRHKRIAVQTLEQFHKYNLIFPASNGVPMSRLNLNRRIFKPVIESIGLDASKYSLYALRHTCATLSLAAGANIKAVAEKLGHSDVNMLLDTYAHVMPSMRDEVTDKLNALLYEKPKKSNVLKMK